MPRKSAVKRTVDETSDSALKRGGSEDGEARVVTTDDSGAGPGGPPVESKADAGADAAPVPNVQAEADHASQAPEDIRDAAVAEPNDKRAVQKGAHVETYSGTGVWECSVGDFVSRTSAEAVQEHIESHHK